MDKEDYRYKINSVQLRKGKSFTPGRINVFVGANNCGKTQILKDMLAYITGINKTDVILDKLDITYPQTWDEMEQAYNMKIVEVNQSKQLRHICPTLDGEPVGIYDLNIKDTLSSWLEHDKREFRAATGAGLVTYLDTDNRLKLAMSQPVEQNLCERGAKNVLEALYIAGSSSSNLVSECIRDIFGIDVYLNSFNLGTLEFRVGEDFSGVSKNPQDAFKELAEYPLLDSQGDGIRSALGMISALVAVKKPVILLDEPEAFLHPPQALQLGKVISELIDDSQQIFIATHSADFVRGLLSSVRDATIIRLERNGNDTVANKLDHTTLKQITMDPLLSSSRVLEGMFYKGVVATEADADSIFYQRVFQKIGAADEIHFVQAQNKQTLKKIITPYQVLGIKFALIADVDIIRDKHEFEELLQIMQDEQLKLQILQQRKKIIDYFQSKDKYEILCEIKSKTKELIKKTKVSEDAAPDKVESALFDFRRDLKKLRDESDELFELKKNGRESLPKDLQLTFDTLWKFCADNGIFIVKVGELESWMIDYGIERTENKAKWIVKALDKLFEIEYDENKEIWKFIDALKDYLTKKIDRRE